MSVSGVGSSTASLPAPELLPAAATVAQPDGTSGEFATGLPFLDASAGATPDDDAAGLTLAELLADKAGNKAEIIKALLAPFLTAIEARMSDFSEIGVLSTANAAIEQEVADLQHQLGQSETDLTAAQTKLSNDQKLLQADPTNQDLIAAVAGDQTNIAAIQTNIAGIQQSIDQDQSQSASNKARIATLQATALTGFAAIASALVQRISEELQKAAAQNQTVAGAVLQIYADLRTFLDDAEAAKVLRLVQQLAEADAVSARVVAAPAGRETDVKQTAAAVARSSTNNPALPGNVSRTAADQAAVPSLATSNTIVPAIEPQPTAQVPTLAPVPADDPSSQENQQTDIAAAAAARQQQQADPDELRIRTGQAVEPAAAEQTSQAKLPQRPSQDPAAAINANSGNTESATLQKSITDGTVQRGDRDRTTDARATDVHVQRQNAFVADLIKKADELTTDLNRLVNRFVKPSATLSPATLSGDSLSVASLQNQQIPGRRKIPV